MDAYKLALSLPLLRVKKGKGFVFGHPTSKKTDDDDDNDESFQSMLIVKGSSKKSRSVTEKSCTGCTRVHVSQDEKQPTTQQPTQSLPPRPKPFWNV